MRTLSITGFALLMVCTAASCFQPQTGSADPEREKDVYAIYSLMLTSPKTSHGADDNERLLIAGTTSPAHVAVSCMRPPKEREAEFREALADYELRKATSRQLKPLLMIPKPYTLLAADEVRAFIQERGSSPGRSLPSERFRGVSDLFTLSDVYFNQRGTLALTALSSWCGGLCGQTQWRVFEKLDTGRWQELRWSLCLAIAENADPRLPLTR
jgi:hypothetical protein